MKIPQIPVVKLPLVDVSTDPLDLFVAGLALRMKQLSRMNPKFIELIHDKNVRLQIGSEAGAARQIIVQNGHIDSVSGQVVSADLAITFKTSEQGVKTLIKGDPSLLMTGVQEGWIKIEGDYSLVLWFARLAKLVPPKVPTPVKAKIKQARQFLKQKTGQ